MKAKSIELPTEDNTRQRVLLVEDKENWQEIMGEILQSKGYVVEIAAGYGEALGKLRREDFALAVVDLSLPTASKRRNLYGILLLENIVDKGIPVIVVTGYGVPELIDELYKEYGVFIILDKETFPPDRFAKYAEEAINDRTELQRTAMRATAEQRMKKFREMTTRIMGVIAERDEAEKSLRELLSIHRRNLAELQKRAASYGRLNVPLSIINEIAFEESQIKNIKYLASLESYTL